MTRNIRAPILVFSRRNAAIASGPLVLIGSYRSVPCVAPSWRHGNRCGSSCRENKVVTVARWQNGLSARLVWK